MYFLGDLTVLAKLVDEASKHMPDLNATSPDATGLDQDITAGTPTPTDSDLAESIEKEELNHGT